MTYNATAGFKSLDGVKVTEKSENSVTLEFRVPASSPYYNGHFPEAPILPAVAQIELALRFAAEHLKTGIDVREIKRIKFSDRVLPNKPHLLRLEINDNNLSFRMFSSGTDADSGERVYSSGTLIMKLNNVQQECGSSKLNKDQQESRSLEKSL